MVGLMNQIRSDLKAKLAFANKRLIDLARAIDISYSRLNRMMNGYTVMPQDIEAKINTKMAEWITSNVSRPV